MSILPLLILASCNDPSSANTVKEDPLFQALSATETGVDFNNRIQDDGTFNFLNFAYIYNGGAVAIGDFNNDDLPDLYFVASRLQNKLYINEGNLKFKDVTAQAGVAASGTGLKSGVTLVDINADGYLDIYQCWTGRTAEECHNQLFINNGDLTFTEQAEAYGLTGSAPSIQANFFDYDLDGDLDLFLVNHLLEFRTANSFSLVQDEDGNLSPKPPASLFESDGFYRNEGNGSFTEITESAGVMNRAFGLSSIIEDFNNDGYPDIYLANDFSVGDAVYINQQNGTFLDERAAYFNHTSFSSMGADIGDINNDGQAEILTLDMLPEDNRRQKLIKVAMENTVLKLMEDYDLGQQYMRNTLQLNNGDGSFSEIGCFSGIEATDWSWTPLMMDFDNDGLRDIYVTNGFRRDFLNQDFLIYTMPKLLRDGKGNLGELLLAIPEEPIANYAFQNKGGLRFENEATAWGLDTLTYSNGAAFADLDKDGDLELIVVNVDQPALIFKNQATEQGSNNYLQLTLSGSEKNLQGIGSKVIAKAGDEIFTQALSPSRGYLCSVEPLIHFGLGDHQVIDELIVRWWDGKEQRLTDVSINQRLNIDHADAQLAANRSTAPNTTWQDVAQAKSLTFTHQENSFFNFDVNKLLPHQLSQKGPSLAVADINGDGLEDIFVGGAMGQSGRLFIQQTDGQFAPNGNQAWSQDHASEDVAALFFDADGDEDFDLYVVSGGNSLAKGDALYQDRLYLNDGNGQFSSASLPQLTQSGSCVSAHDFDQDGDLDLFIGNSHVPREYPSTPQQHILKNENGTFQNVTQTIAPAFGKAGMLNDISWANLDQDPELEMIACGEWTPIMIFDYNGQTFEDATASYELNQTRGWWNTVEAVDWDKDGDLDLIAGNQGLNNRYEAPVRIYAQDFDGNGQVDPLMTWEQEGKEYLIPQRDLAISQIPQLKKSFTNYETYATADFSNVIPADQRANIQMLETDLFASVLLLNEGGKFRRVELPTHAQFAPIKSLLVKDFNQDGFPDLLCVGNDYTPNAELGRQDAGIGALLQNDQNGGFQYIPNIQSGIWAKYDARKVASVQSSGGKQLIIVANNDQALQLFERK